MDYILLPAYIFLMTSETGLNWDETRRKTLNDMLFISFLYRLVEFKLVKI